MTPSPELALIDAHEAAQRRRLAHVQRALERDARSFARAHPLGTAAGIAASAVAVAALTVGAQRIPAARSALRLGTTAALRMLTSPLL